MRLVAFCAFLATAAVGVLAAPQGEPAGPVPKAGGPKSGKAPGGGGKAGGGGGGGGGAGNSGPTGLGGILGSGARPGNGCANLEVLIARGTYEPGPFGIIVGDPLMAAVKAKVPGSRGYAVQYPADASANSKNNGVTDTLRRLNQQAKDCPNAKLAMVGYSQGASVMHATAPKLDDAIAKKVIAFVMYGDPARRSGKLAGPLQSKVFENCAQGDMCGNSTHNGAGNGHLSYGSGPFHSSSAAFIAAAFNGSPQPPRP